MRVSDAERDAVLERLRVAVGEGRLDLSEFSSRADATLAARTVDDLRRVTADLPPPPPTPAWTPLARPGASGTAGWGTTGGQWPGRGLLQTARGGQLLPRRPVLLRGLLVTVVVVWAAVAVAAGFGLTRHWLLWAALWLVVVLRRASAGRRRR